MTQRVYLDHNATSILRPEAQDAMINALEFPGNASSIHEEGRKARALIEDARRHLAGLVQTSPQNVVFTSGGTEANITALSPELVCANRKGSSKENVRCFISAIEHPCVHSGGRFNKDDITYLPVSGEGVVIIEKVKETITDFRHTDPEAPFLVSVMMANNETGAIQPVSEISQIVHEAGGLLHVDAVQAVGKINVECANVGADLLTISAHKIGGPQGIGALILCSKNLVIGPSLMRGGGQELNRRAGTENVAAIAGFGAAAEQSQKDLETISQIETLRDEMETKLLKACPEMFVFALNVERLPNTSCFAIPGMSAETLLIALDLEGIAVSSGSACSSGKVERSHVLSAMGVEEDLARGAIRISLGWNTTQEDVNCFLQVWSDIYKKFKQGRVAA